MVCQGIHYGRDDMVKKSDAEIRAEAMECAVKLLKEKSWYPREDLTKETIRMADAFYRYIKTGK
jgi:hypothetical protein